MPERFCQSQYRTKVRGITGQSVQLSRERSFEGSTVSAVVQVSQTSSTNTIHTALTRYVFIASEWGSDLSFVRKLDGVCRGGREQALQECDRGVEHNTTLTAVFDTSMDLVEVDEFGANIMNVVD